MFRFPLDKDTVVVVFSFFLFFFFVFFFVLSFFFLFLNPHTLRFVACRLHVSLLCLDWDLNPGYSIDQQATIPRQYDSSTSTSSSTFVCLAKPHLTRTFLTYSLALTKESHLNNGVGESSGFYGRYFRENNRTRHVKQLSTTPLNSGNQVKNGSAPALRLGE